MENEFEVNENTVVNIEESTHLDDDAKRAEKVKSDKKQMLVDYVLTLTKIKIY